MRESTKKLLISIGCLLFGGLAALSLSEATLLIDRLYEFIVFIIVFLSGRYYGAAQGWWEIELRQDWRNTRTWTPKDLVGILLGFGPGMKPDEVEKEGWNPPRKDNM